MRKIRLGNGYLLFRPVVYILNVTRTQFICQASKTEFRLQCARPDERGVLSEFPAESRAHARLTGLTIINQFTFNLCYRYRAAQYRAAPL